MPEFIQYSDFFGPNTEANFKAYFERLGDIARQSTQKIITDIQNMAKGVTNELTASNIKSQANVTSAISAGKQKISELQSMMNELNKVESQMAAIQNKTNWQGKTQELENQKVAYQKLNAEQKLQAKINAEAVGSYNRINLELQKTRTILKALGTEEAGYTQKKAALIARIREMDTYLKKADADMGLHQRNVGNYKSALGGLGNSIKSLVGTYLSLYSIVNLVKNIFENTRALDTLTFSYKTLIKDSKEFALTQVYLSDLTERYGLNLLSTSQSYLKFRASISETNYDLEESRKLFDSVAKAGATLGLRADRMELVFLALEQMISKGTISTEELRRQLGDLLPGSMQIMADALEVSIPKLLEMVKANKVLASEALPKFRVELEKAYGIETVTKIDTLQSSIGRFQNAWLEMIKAINASKLSRGIVDMFTGIIESFTPTDYANRSLSIYTKEMKSINSELNAIGKTGNSKLLENALASIWKDNGKQLDEYRNKLDIVNNKLLTLGTVPIVGRTLRAQQKYYATMIDGLKSVGVELEKIIESGNYEKFFGKKKSPEIQLGYLDEIKEKIKELQEKMSVSRDKTFILNKEKEIEAWQAIEKYINGLNFDTTKIEKLKDRYNELKEAAKAAQVLGWTPERSVDILKEEESVRKLIDAYDKFWKAQLIAPIKPKALTFLAPEGLNVGDYIRSREEINKILEDLENELYVTTSKKRKAELEQQIKDWKRTYEIVEYTFAEKILIKLGVDPDELKNVQNDLNFLQDSLRNLYSAWTEYMVTNAETQLKIHEKVVEDLKKQLDEEKSLKEEGNENDYDLLLTKLAKEEAERKKAFENYKRIKKQEAAINLAAQTSNLLLSVTELFAAHSSEGWAGLLIAIAAAASMLASFYSYKSKIDAINSEQYGEGGWVKGKSHKEGGEHIVAEGDEFVTNKKSAKKSRTLLEAINEGKLDDSSIYNLNFNRIPDNVQVYNSYAEVVKAIEKTTRINEKILEHQKNTPQMYEKNGDLFIIKGNSVQRYRIS